METTTAFDLTLAIKYWRENLAKSAAFRGENLNELESHLCDSIAVLQSHGLSAEEAFIVAARRIGGGLRLETEFGKVNGPALWLDRVLWMLIGIQFWLVIFIPYSAAGWIAHIASGNLIKSFPGISERAFDLAIILAPSLFLTVIVLIGWRFVLKSGRSIGDIFVNSLRRPEKLALALFLICLCFRLLDDCFLAHFLNRSVSIWQSIGLSLLNFVPQYAAIAVLTVIVARKRLRMSKA